MDAEPTLSVRPFHGETGGEYRVELNIAGQRMSRLCRDYTQVLRCLEAIGLALGISSAKFDKRTITIYEDMVTGEGTPLH